MAGSTPSPIRRILVDDNIDSAESLALLIQVLGHQAHTAHDGVTALEAVQRDRPDVVFLDLTLPRLSGFEVARQLRAELGTQCPMLIALTGHGEEEDRRRSLEAGFARHMVKPIDPADISRLLASLELR